MYRPAILFDHLYLISASVSAINIHTYILSDAGVLHYI